MPEAETRSGMMGMMPVHFATMYVTSYGTVLVDRPVGPNGTYGSSGGTYGSSDMFGMVFGVRRRF